MLKALGAAAALPFAGALPAAERGDARDRAESLHKLPRQALVIGNAAYKLAPLRNPLNDARAVAEGLKRSGFQVASLLDAGRAEMQQAIQSYVQALAKERSIGLFYFAGHGAQLAWRNYLLPVDAVIESLDQVGAQTFDLGVLLQGLGKADNPMNVVILDACRDNPFGAGVVPQQKGLSQFDAPSRSLLAYATAPGNVANDGEGAHGLYTGHLVRELAVPETKIEDVFKRVRLAVRRASQGRQIPWESTSLEHDFYFVPPAALGQPAEAVAARRFDEELALWEKIKAATEPGPLEAYLRRYPSGNFSEVAQLRLEQVLARLGERRIRIESAPENPYTRGSATADVDRKVGDTYTYRVLDGYTRLVTQTYTETIVRITDTEVHYDTGRITDLLGNILRFRDGRTVVGGQLWGVEYAVGKRWTARARVTTPGVGEFHTELEVRVVSREKVEVPAGVFDAFRITQKGWSSGKNEVQIDHSLWIAPDRVRGVIAAERSRRSGRKVIQYDREELVAYRQS